MQLVVAIEYCVQNQEEEDKYERSSRCDFSEKVTDMMVVVRNRSCTIYDNNRILKDLLVAEDPDSDDQVKPWAQAHHPNSQQVQFIA